MATRAEQRLLTATEFLRIDFGADLKAELDNGVIRMMAGGTYAHSIVQMNLSGFFRDRLRGSGCRPHGSDMAVQVGDYSVRYPDVTIDCAGPHEPPRGLVLSRPTVIVEILSASTREIDLGVKLDEYRAIGSVHTVVFIDADAETIAVTRRTDRGGWTDLVFAGDADLEILTMNIVMPRSEIFARD